VPGQTGMSLQVLSIAALTAVLFAFYLYSPALNGPFVFDDHALPYASPAQSQRPLLEWISGVRPVLMLSYWANGRLLKPDAASYHAVNVLLHVVNSILVWIFIRGLLRLRGIAGKHALIISGAVATLFLVHPVQTESVAYIAGRSETLTAMFSLSALAVFVFQPIGTMSMRAAVLILACYAAAVLSKEQAVVLPALFLLMDILLLGRPLRQAIEERRRLYIGLGVLAAAGLVFVARVLLTATTAGFGMHGLSAYEYFLTQSRVAFLYVQLVLLPFWQNADYDLPISRGLLDHGAFIALLAIVAGVTVAWRVRHRYPVAVYGIGLFLICLAPTSTFIPIKDVAAERRLYLPLLGALLVLVEVLLTRPPRWLAGVAITAVIGAVLTYDRAAVWGSDVAFWSDTVSKSVTKTRGYAHLTHAYLRRGQCGTALSTALKFPPRAAEDSDFLVSLGYAYDCVKRYEDGVRAYERAAARSPGVGTYLLLTGAYERIGRTTDAERARSEALRREPQTTFDRMALEQYRRTEQLRSRTGQNP
jgi:protein O-mannosyl-transferase